MIVTIWRHGEAGRAATDRQRALTARGLDDVALGSRRFRRNLAARDMAAPDLLLHSPWLRTGQTAGVIASTFPAATSRELAVLYPGGNVAAVDEALTALTNSAKPPLHTVLVSHQPLVSQLLEYYLGADSGVPSLCPGALATIAMEIPARACAELHFWAVPPEYEPGL